MTNPPEDSTPPSMELPSAPAVAPTAPTAPAAPATKRRFPPWLIVVLVITIPVMLLVCAIVGIGVLTLLGNRVEDPKAPRTVVTSTDGHSQVSTPTSWASRTDLNDKAEIQVANARVEQYLIVLTEAKSDLAVEGLEGYAKIVSDQMAELATDATISEPTKLTINGMPAIQYRIAGTVDTTRAVYWLTAIEGKEHYYQVLGWTLASKEQDNEATILGVVNSFEETGK